jgi:hypothetical protein
MGMHIVNWTIAGLLILALIVFAAALINRRRGAWRFDGAKFFAGAWLFCRLVQFL